MCREEESAGEVLVERHLVLRTETNGGVQHLGIACVAFGTVKVHHILEVVAKAVELLGELVFFIIVLRILDCHIVETIECPRFVPGFG